MAGTIRHGGFSLRLLIASTFATVLITGAPVLKAAEDSPHPEGRYSWIGDLPGIYRTSAKFNEWEDFVGSSLSPYRVDPYINAAIKLQTMGKAEATRTLLDAGAYHSEQTVLLCRMLFNPKRKGAFRGLGLRPMRTIGMIKQEAWPRFPLAIVDGVPFCITAGAYGVVGDTGEAGDNYVQYCVETCEWSRIHHRHKTADEKRIALARLMSTAPWERSVTAQEWNYLQAEIE